MKGKVKVKARDEKTGKFKKGNKAALKHGAYSLARTRQVPSVRGVRALTKYLARVKGELEQVTPGLNIQKELLIGQIVRTEEKICLIDMWARKIGMIRPDRAQRGIVELQPSIGNSYVRFMNTQRLALTALGIDNKKAEKILTPLEIAAEFDRKKEEDAKGKQ